MITWVFYDRHMIAIYIKIIGYRQFPGEKKGHIWEIRSKFGHFWPQISPYLAPTVTKNSQNQNYLGVLWSEQTFLALNINIKCYRHFPAKIMGIFGETGPNLVI